jgi:predicted dienelactone hydrolase
MRFRLGLIGLAVLWLGLNAAQAEPPFSRPGVDAPALAALGPYGVGVRTLALTEVDVPDLSAFDKAKGAAPLKDRKLVVELWYPARTRPGDTAVTYSGALPSEAMGQVAAFTVSGIAVRDAPADAHGPFPLIIMSHGYSGTPVAMSWLAENLASKGYVVAAPHHDDPPITDPGGFALPFFLRPLDIAFVARTLQGRARAHEALFGAVIDPDRVALAGYSMGGYGVLTVAGAAVSPGAAALVPGGYFKPYGLGGAKTKALRVDGLKAVVAISPAGGGGGFRAWGPDGLAELRTPTLFIVGDQDKVVGYSPGVKSIFEGAVNAPRSLLVFENGGHSIGMNGAPETMKQRLWDLDWFEDPVWRKSRVIGVNLHFITAFLDLNVKGDSSRAAYLNLTPQSNQGAWPNPAASTPYGSFSPGGEGMVWKGFQRVHSAGLEFHHLEPATPSKPPERGSASSPPR